MLEQHLTGRSPAYRRYTCADGVDVVLGAIEPKFWADLCEALELPEIAGDALETSDTGQAASGKLGARFADQPAGHWLTIAKARNLPLTAVRSPAQALADSPPPRSTTRAPGLGADTAKVLAEFGIAPVTA